MLHNVFFSFCVRAFFLAFFKHGDGVWGTLDFLLLPSEGGKWGVKGREAAFFLSLCGEVGICVPYPLLA